MAPAVGFDCQLSPRFTAEVFASESTIYINYYHQTPLIEAIRGHNINQVERELNKKKAWHSPLDLTLDIDSQGHCALYWAIETGSHSILKLLFKHNVDFEASYTHSNERPLLHAIRLQKEDIVILLLQQGVSLNKALETSILHKAKNITHLIINEIVWRAGYRVFVNNTTYEPAFQKTLYETACLNKKQILDRKMLCSFLEKLRTVFSSDEEDAEEKSVALLEETSEEYLSSIKTFARLFPNTITTLTLDYAGNTLLPYYGGKNKKPLLNNHTAETAKSSTSKASSPKNIFSHAVNG